MALAAVVAAVLLGPVSSTRAAESTPRQRLVELKAELDERRAALRSLDSKEKSLILTIGELDRSLGKLVDEQEAALRRQGELEDQLEQLREALAADEARLAKSSARLGRRLRALYTLSQGGAVRHLLGAETFEDLAYRRRMLETLTRADVRLVREHARVTTLVGERREALARSVEEAREVAEAITAQADILSATRKERAAAMRRIDREKELGVRAVREIVAQQREIQRELSRRIRKTRRSRGRRRGKGVLAQGLQRPVAGTVFRPFGTTRVAGAKVTSNGLHIRAPLGTPVAAPAAGRVVYTGWQRGMGRIVILDHDEGHHTIFAHLSRATVARGERVARAQTLGFVGDTDSLEGAKLYFELRDRGKPIDPARYLR